MRLWYWIILGVAAIGLAFFFDREVVFWMEAHRVEWLNAWMVFLSDFGLLFGLMLFMIALFERHLEKQILLIVLALAGALEASFLLKEIFMVPRPFVTWPIEPLKAWAGYSFPSMHAAFIFAALPFFRRGRLARYYGVWLLFAVLVAGSRVYAGVHYLSDVVAGMFLGYGIGAFLDYLEWRWDITGWLATHLKDEFEVRRQVAHAVLGLGIVFLYWVDLMTPEILLLGLLVGGTLSIVSRWVDVPGLRHILDYFERPHHRRNFPGRGSFFMVLGCLISVLVFPKTVALAAMTIMAVGDSVTNIFGRYFGEVRLPYNRKKTVDGVLVAVAAATLGSAFFVPFPVAFLASSGAMFMESLDLKIWVEIDDNVMVPLVAGGLMMVLL